jgi:hypothetical protein
MPLGINRTDLDSSHTNYRKGTPVTLPKNFGNPVNTATKNFGNAVTLPVVYGSPVTTPHDFGNDIIAGN